MSSTLLQQFYEMEEKLAQSRLAPPSTPDASPRRHRRSPIAIVGLQVGEMISLAAILGVAIALGAGVAP